MNRECFEDIAIDSEICQLHREWIGSGSLFHPIDIFYTRRIQGIRPAIRGLFRYGVLPSPWPSWWTQVSCAEDSAGVGVPLAFGRPTPSRVFSAADAALSLGSAESGKSKECRGMCFSRIRSKGSRFTLGVWGLRCVRSMLRNPSQPQPSTGGRVRPVWPCPWRVLQKWSLLEVSSAA